MKTKLEMAHEFMLAMIKAGCHDGPDLLDRAWCYADAMQAEADKRECKERTDVLLTKDKDGNCLHFHHEFGHKKCMDCGASLEEWQPDWSQAPRCDVVSWDINEHGQARWIASDNGYYLAPSFGYTGDWRNSLRKRPE